MGNKARQSNIELLRIITICGVVILHYNGNVAFSLVAEGSANYYLLQFLEILFICAVNLFVLISGYFLYNTNSRKAIKAVELVAQVILIGVAKYLANVIFFHAPLSLTSLVGAAIPNNYFVTLYLTVYLLSPYVNIGLKKLSDKQFTVLLALCLALFSVWPTILDMVCAIIGFHFNGMYPIGSGGSQYGYNFLNFMLMYLLGAYLRRKPVGKALWDGVGLVICLVVLMLWQMFYPAIARAYCNPFVIAVAVFVFRLFAHLRFSSKLVNTLAKGAFTCFLFHDFCLWHLGVEKVANRSLPILFGHILISVSLIFLVSWVIWKVYDWVTKPLFSLLAKPLSKLDVLLSPREIELNEETQ
ncbi:MAG: acyltransferase [Oscillospiraceae bacterium]|nr:acyltransferase [Oscillospiraceae bacterium]